jgi:D-proline reductase (dithiol) PrdB
MVRLTDLSQFEREHLMIKDVGPIGPDVWSRNPKPLNKKRIALITTAGLHFRDDETFQFSDATFRPIPNEEDAGNLVMSHSSANFDRSGFQEDVNLVFPLDRFKELVANNTIGSLATVHYSFMGAGLLPEVYEKTVRSLATLLKKDNVDAVFITPVCPNCTRATCAIAYYLESEGIMTTGVALVRENAEAMRPPRLLWVSFPMGHPLGKPGDANFQHEVIRHSLDLLLRPAGPVLEDYPLDVPPVSVEDAPACPISFARPEIDESTWHARLANELLLMRPWYDLSKRRRGRTTVGVSSSTIEEILDGLAKWLDHPQGALPDLKWFKYAIEDAKAYYSEALIAQPGNYPSGHILQLFWGETQLGEAIKRYHEYFEGDPNLKPFSRIVASRDAIHRSTGHYAIGLNNERVEQSGRQGQEVKSGGNSE